MSMPERNRPDTATSLPVNLPKHTELVSAADGKHVRELSDYHHWLAEDESSGAAKVDDSQPSGDSAGSSEG